MGYEFRYEKDGQMTNCFPMDTATDMWIPLSGDKSLSEIIELAKEKWPEKDFSEITLDSVNHHQYCIYYDLHDSSDYVQYLVLSVEE